MRRYCSGCRRVIQSGNGSYCGECKRQKNSREARGYGSAWRRKSAWIIRRDGGVCQLRLPGCTIKATTVDHIVPKVAGGSDLEVNLQAACAHCNSSKGGRIGIR